MPIMAGPLQGYLWNTSSNYDYLLNEYENEHTLKQFYSWLNSETVFYDLGANVGYYSFLANRYITSGTIYGFEPIPYNVALFKKHCELNHRMIKHENIEILPFAITDRDGQLSISHDQAAIEGNTYIVSPHITVSDKITVECRSIDGLIKEGFKAPDVIKIDVEGAEYDVLKGAKATIEKYKPNILLATHDCHLPGVQQQCKDFLEALGYRLTHLPTYNKYISGLDDYIAIHEQNSGKYGSA